MKRDDARRALAACDDFATQPIVLEELTRARGHLLIYLPKFHCELNPMELLWSACKRYARGHCDYRFGSLRNVVPAALASVPKEHIRRFFLHCREVEHAYRTTSTALSTSTTTSSTSASTGSVIAAAPAPPPSIAASSAQFVAVREAQQKYKSHRRALLTQYSLQLSPLSCPCPVCTALAAVTDP
jgi:transposase